MEFPQTRLRRLRTTAPMRSLVRETHPRSRALVYPLFICPGEGVRREVSSMPGVFNLSVDEAVKEAEEAAHWESAACCFSACRKRKTSKAPARTTQTASCSRGCAR